MSKTISQRFFISSKSDVALGQKVILIIEGNKIDALNFNDLDKYEKPKEILYLEKFKETKSGKIDRKATIAEL